MRPAPKTSADRVTVTPGKTRVCPHCKSVILDSADVCPVCRHHLRFGSQAERRSAERRSAFRVEGTITQPADPASEYSVVIAIRDQRGHEVKRHIIDVGAMQPNDKRTFELTVEINPAN